jgi:hypothetical protein
VCILLLEILCHSLTLILSDHPDIQEKIRRCIEQRHIDAEDFKGVRLALHFIFLVNSGLVFV